MVSPVRYGVAQSSNQVCFAVVKKLFIVSAVSCAFVYTILGATRGESQQDRPCLSESHVRRCFYECKKFPKISRADPLVARCVTACCYNSPSGSDEQVQEFVMQLYMQLYLFDD